jgi:hypothetical protein
MFQRKLTLTASTLGLLEDIRTAIEVLNGTQIRFKHIEFEKGLTSGHGAFYHHDGTELPLTFIRKDRGGEITLDLAIDNQWFFARFDTPRQVRIIGWCESSNWMVGTSATDRHEESVF